MWCTDFWHTGCRGSLLILYLLLRIYGGRFELANHWWSWIVQIQTGIMSTGLYWIWNTVLLAARVPVVYGMRPLPSSDDDRRRKWLSEKANARHDIIKLLKTLHLILLFISDHQVRELHTQTRMNSRKPSPIFQTFNPSILPLTATLKERSSEEGNW